MTPSIALLTVALALTGCSVFKSNPHGLLAQSLHDIQPLNDRDHYVFVWQRLVDGKREADGVHVEHVTALDNKDEYEIAISEDGVPSGRLRVLYNDGALALIDEDDITQGIRLTYSPPLLQLTTPLVSGERHVSGKADIQRLEDGTSVNIVDVIQTTRLGPARRIESELGQYDNGVSVRTKRTLQTPAGAIELKSAVLLVPGLGEIRSEGSANATAITAGKPEAPHLVVTRRELACAIIDGKAVGDCRRVPEQLAKLRSESE